MKARPVASRHSGTAFTAVCTLVSVILILEDNAERIEAFRRVAARVAPGMDVVVWSDARAMIREVGDRLEACRLISLDHDLYAPPGSPDPGDGLEVAKFLVSRPLVRPVIIHSSNADRSRWMVGEFELAGWPCSRVLPFGEGWVEEWRAEVARILEMGRDV